MADNVSSVRSIRNDSQATGPMQPGELRQNADESRDVMGDGQITMGTVMTAITNYETDPKNASPYAQDFAPLKHIDNTVLGEMGKYIAYANNPNLKLGPNGEIGNGDVVHIPSTPTLKQVCQFFAQNPEKLASMVQSAASNVGLNPDQRKAIGSVATSAIDPGLHID